MLCSTNVESHGLSTPSRSGCTLNQAISEIRLAIVKNAQGSEHLVSTVHNDLFGAQQNLQDLFDLLTSDSITGGQHPIKLNYRNQRDETWAVGVQRLNKR